MIVVAVANFFRGGFAPRKGSLSGFFVWAIGQGLFDGTGIDPDPTIGMANAPTKGPRTHVPTDAEIVKTTVIATSSGC
jgi:hypothetical protein